MIVTTIPTKLARQQIASLRGKGCRPALRPAADPGLILESPGDLYR